MTVINTNVKVAHAICVKEERAGDDVALERLSSGKESTLPKTMQLVWR